MVLIISEDRDVSTNLICKWLIHKGVSFIRLNNTDFITSIKIVLNNESEDIDIEVNKTYSFKISEITSFIHRKGSLHFSIPENLTSTLLKMYLEVEYETCSDLVHRALENFANFGSELKAGHLNKLNTLKLAKSVGLKIPSTIVTNSRLELLDFYNRYSSVITKPISKSYRLELEPGVIYAYSGTHSINLLNLDSMTKDIAPCLLQENIKKKYEIRTFFLDGNCYSMAILSQNDPRTQQDYRNYSIGNPNRYVPYNLPKIISDKIKRLMSKLSLNTGSLDFVVDMEGDYIFLEVNPSGQFGWLSHYCNYYLEEKIVNYIIKHEK